MKYKAVGATVSFTANITVGLVATVTANVCCLRACYTNISLAC